MVATQSRINGGLAEAIGSSVDAATISFVTGCLLVWVYLVSSASGRRGVGNLVRALRQRRIVPWQLVGGFIGAFVVWSQSLAVPAIGVALFTVALVAGQASNSLIVDRWGIGTSVRIPVTTRRTAAAFIGVAGVLIAVWPRVFGESGVSWNSVALVALIASAVAGVLIAVQQGINGSVATAASSSWTATGVNFACGALALTVVVGVLAVVGEPFRFSELPASPLLYVGGPMGLVFIAGAAWVVPLLGVLRFALVSIAGQLFAALVWDVVAPTAGAMVSAHLVIAMLLTFVAVVVSARR